jgi:hypothetical protein
MKRFLVLILFLIFASLPASGEFLRTIVGHSILSDSAVSPLADEYEPAPESAANPPSPSSALQSTPPGGAAPAPTVTSAVVVDGVKYPCSGAGVIAAIMDAYAAAMGTVDARGCSNISSTSEIDVGTPAGYPLTLLVPNFGVWTFSINNSSACGIKQFTHTSIVGTAAAGSGSFSLIAAPGASMFSLFCTDPSPLSGGSYLATSGVSAGNPNRAAIAGALITFQHLFDSSETDRIMAFNFFGIGIQFTDFCCGAIFKNTVSDGYGNPGAAPVLIGGGTTAGGPLITGGAFYGLSAVHQGAGQNALQVNYNSQAMQVNNVQIHNLMLEWKTGTDTTTARVELIGAYSVSFDGVVANPGPADTSYMFEIQNTGTPKNILIRDISQPLGTGYLIHNEFTGTSISGANWLGHYEYYGGRDECYQYNGSGGSVCSGTNFTAANLGATSNIVANGTITAASLTPGNCLQASTGGLVVSAPGPCLTVVSSGSSRLPTVAVRASTCAAVITTSALGVASTDPIIWSYASAPTISEGQFILSAYPTAGNVNFKLCNPTQSPLASSGLIVNWRVVR